MTHTLKNCTNLYLIASLTPQFQREPIQYLDKISHTLIHKRYKNPRNASVCFCYLVWYENEYYILYSHGPSSLNEFIHTMFDLPLLYSNSSIEGNLKNIIDKLPRHLVPNIDSMMVIPDIGWKQTIPKVKNNITNVRIDYEKYYPEYCY